MQVVLWYHSLNRKKNKRNVSSEEQKRKMVMGQNKVLPSYSFMDL